MYSTILVPLDGSHRAEAILSTAEELALALQATLVLLRVVDPAETLTGLEGMAIEVTRELVEQQAEDARRYLTARQNALAARKINSRVEVRYGSVVQSIIEVAESENADLIAMASHGRTGLARLFYGSVAAGVLNRVDRPLLIVRAGDH